MKNLLETSLQGVNIVYTIFLALSLVYWFSVIIGLITVDTLDFEVDVHHDVDISHDLEVHQAELGETGLEAGMASFLSFFNIGVVPFMLVFSVFSLISWSLGVLTTDFISGGNWAIDIALLLPNWAASLLGSALVLRPARPFFKNMKQDNAPRSLVGRSGELHLPLSPNTVGQANVKGELTDSLVQVILIGEDPLPKGAPVLLTGYDKEKNCFLVEKL